MAIKGTPIQQKKEHAKLLYTSQGITQQNILAERVGVSKQTINKWINSEGWEKLRASLIITSEAELRRFYTQVTELNDHIMKKPEGERFANSKEADVLIKLAGAIRHLETDVSIGEVMEVLKKLINFISKEDLEAAKLLTTWADIYVKTLLR